MYSITYSSLGFAYVIESSNDNEAGLGWGTPIPFSSPNM